MISRKNNVRSTCRIRFDRLYMAHTRSIITTGFIINGCLLWEGKLTIGRSKKYKECPLSDDREYLTF